MSMEFWYGAIFSAVLFLMGSIISVFSSDLRAYFLTWQKDKTLRGLDLRIRKAEFELSRHERLASDPAAATAFFWSGLYLLITITLLLAMLGFLASQINSALFRHFGTGFVIVTWLIVYTLAHVLHRQADALRDSQTYVSALKQHIRNLKARLPH